ncbi:hypothetical protein FRC11_005949 [Ceratobasidium sp. 423]|nr:hypothetical protein FRC11_005949 [Ceratobasidium sp. 423]
MPSHTSTPSNISSVTHAISEGFSDYSRSQVAPYILADLTKFEDCDMDALLGVFLDRCRPTETTPRAHQSADAFHTLPPSTLMETPPGKPAEAIPDPTPLAPEPQTADHLARCELLDTCLKKVTSTCKDAQLQGFIHEYQQGWKETPRYEPFAKLANHALGLLNTLELTELRQAAETNILFHVSNEKQIAGRGRSKHSPDLIVVSEAAMTRIQGPSSHTVKGCSGAKSSTTGWFEWPDVFMSNEMKWDFAILDPTEPQTDADQVDPIPQLPRPSSAPANSSNSASSMSNTISSASASSISIRSGSAHSSEPLADRVGSVEASTPNHLKRHYVHPKEGDARGPSMKRTKMDKADKVVRNKGLKESKREAVEQIGINGAEMLRCSYGRRHALGLVIIDKVLWIWWFDRQGAIQSTGVNFIEDLPRFLVFLAAIQRFSLSDWGFDLELDPSISRRHLPPKPDGTLHGSMTAELNINDHLKITFSTSMEKLINDVFRIGGRSTLVFDVKSSTEQSPLVAKLSWPNKDQLDEATIIELALQRAPHLRDHLPRVFGSRDIDPIGTRRIREELGISSNSPRSPRVLRITVFERLLPITELSKKEFLEVWVQCVRCHYVAWNHCKVYHRDLSYANIMYRRINGVNHGVVNDWDLSHVEGKSEPRVDVIATIPFMPIDLLRLTMTSQEPIKRLYYYDLESLVWILIWTSFGELMNIDPHGPLAGWRSSQSSISAGARSLWLPCPDFAGLLEDWKDQLPLVKALAAWLYPRVHHPDKDETKEKNKEVLDGFLKIVGENLGSGMPNAPMIDGL